MKTLTKTILGSGLSVFLLRPPWLNTMAKKVSNY